MDSIQANSSDAQPNDVWGTINKGIDAISAFARATGKQSQTQAAPTGTASGTIWNPFPGTQGAFPQAEGKVGFGGVVVSAPLLLILAAVAIIAFALIRR